MKNGVKKILLVLFISNCWFANAQVNHKKVAKIIFEKLKETQGSSYREFAKDFVTLSDLKQMYKDNPGIGILKEMTKYSQNDFDKKWRSNYNRMKNDMVEKNIDTDALEYVDFISEEIYLGNNYSHSLVAKFLEKEDVPTGSIYGVGGNLYTRHNNIIYRSEISVICIENQILPGYTYKLCKFEDFYVKR